MVVAIGNCYIDAVQLTLPRQRTLDLSRPCIMGVLNVTPDSFSDAGMWLDSDSAIAHAMEMISLGARVIDVGGESTRPGALRVSEDQQIARVVAVTGRLRSELERLNLEAAISVDTTRSVVAQAALDSGADIINDVTAGRDDPAILALAAQRKTPLVLMHMQGEPRTMQNNPQYEDVVNEVRAFLLERAQVAMDAGVAQEQIIIDPGIGFGKTAEHNLELVAHLDQLVKTGYPVLLGTSRKRFLGATVSDAAGEPPLPRQLVGATCATTVVGVLAGVQMFRVHDVRENAQAAQVAWALDQQRGAARGG